MVVEDVEFVVINIPEYFRKRREVLRFLIDLIGFKESIAPNGSSEYRSNNERGWKQDGDCGFSRIDPLLS